MVTKADFTDILTQFRALPKSDVNEAYGIFGLGGKDTVISNEVLRSGSYVRN